MKLKKGFWREALHWPAGLSDVRLQLLSNARGADEWAAGEWAAAALLARKSSKRRRRRRGAHCSSTSCASCAECSSTLKNSSWTRPAQCSSTLKNTPSSSSPRHNGPAMGRDTSSPKIHEELSTPGKRQRTEWARLGLKWTREPRCQEWEQLESMFWPFCAAD